MSVYLRSGLRGVMRMLPRVMSGTRAQSQSYVSRKLTTNGSGAQGKIASHLLRMFQAVKKGLRAESNVLARRVKEESAESPESFRQMKEAIKKIMKKEPEQRTDNEASSIKNAEHYEQKLVDKLHECHNFNLASNLAYRTQYEEAVFSCLAKTCAAEEMTERTFVFRGVQFDKHRPTSEESIQIASPVVTFNRHTSGPIFPLKRGHHRGVGERLMPTIHDAHLASEKIYEQGRVGWSAGVVAQSLDTVISANYSRAAQGLDPSEGRCDGYIYMIAPRRVITLANHLYHGIDVSATKGADKNYEMVSAVSDPSTIVCAWRVDKDGNLGPQTFNSQVDGKVKNLYDQAEVNNPALGALLHASNVTELAQFYQQYQDPSILDFHSQMAVDKEAHVARVAKRLAAQELKEKKC